MSKKNNRLNEIAPKIIDELIKTYEKTEDLLGEGGILKQVRKVDSGHKYDFLLKN